MTALRSEHWCNTFVRTRTLRYALSSNDAKHKRRTMFQRLFWDHAIIRGRSPLSPEAGDAPEGPLKCQCTFLTGSSAICSRRFSPGSCRARNDTPIVATRPSKTSSRRDASYALISNDAKTQTQLKYPRLLWTFAIHQEALHIASEAGEARRGPSNPCALSARSMRIWREVPRPQLPGSDDTPYLGTRRMQHLLRELRANGRYALIA